MIEHEAILMSVRNYLREADEFLKSGDYDRARTSAEQAIDTALRQDHLASLAAAYYGMASVIWGSGGASEDAHRYASMAAQNTKANTTTDLLVRTLIARIKLARGNYDAAILLNEDLLRFYYEQNRLDGIADVLRSLGDVYLTTGDYAKALERYTESLKLYQNDLDDSLNHAGVLVSLGSLMYQINRPTEAQSFWADARAIAEANGYRHIISGLDSAMEALKNG